MKAFFNKLDLRKIDIKSIKFKLWAYFILFAVILLGLIWLLQIFFLNTYYEEMKKTETTKIANEIKNEYASSSYSTAVLKSAIQSSSLTNDLTIYVISESGETITSSDTNNGFGPNRSDDTSAMLNGRYATDIISLYNKLQNSKLGSATTIIEKRSNARTLEFACYLNSSDDNDADGDGSTSYILYIFSPLFPVKSTIYILRSQLIYITIISILLALALALYLANRISKPIKDITSSAAEMGKGNYSVKFKGGHYSEITELADTLTAAEGELEKTDMYQKDLIANVSHDLRTPLTMIKSYAEMVRDLSGDNPVKREAHLQVIIDETDRLNQLVNDMLNLSRMQSKKIVLEKAPFDLSKATEAILSSYDILAESDGYNFEFNCNETYMVNGDETKIKQVMSNLVNNAVKYCGEDKKIIINVTKNNRYVRFAVTDHGEGISPDEINHVWERYYKSSTHHVRPTEGSGLGLSIVKEILNLHKANFDVDSTLGKGSTFWFELPILKQ